MDFASPQPTHSRTVWRSVTDHALSPGEDTLACEVPVALVYNGISHTVMMCSPVDLEDFALGFSLAEGIIHQASELYGIDVVPGSTGINIHLEISSRRASALTQHQRALAGRTGCGICGTEQLKNVVRPVAPLPSTQTFDLNHLDPMLRGFLRSSQYLGSRTGATHAAIWLSPAGEMSGIREDIGRHVALDKLIGLRAQKGWKDGAVLVTSRASFEMVQKTATAGIEILMAVSAATTMAADLADQYDLSLAGFCRPGRSTVYSGQHRFL